MSDHDHAKRMSSVDFFRFFAVLAVIVIHTHPFDEAYDKYRAGESAYRAAGLSEVLIIGLVAFAVPFFFITSGYFFGRNMAGADAPRAVLGRYLRRLGALWSFWSLFYFLVPVHDASETMEYGYLHHLFADIQAVIADPLLLLNSGIGGASHLWFLAHLILSLLIVYVFLRLRALTPALVILGSVNILSEAVGYDLFGLHSVLLVLFGAWLSTRRCLPRPRYAAALCTAGLLISYARYLALPGEPILLEEGGMLTACGLCLIAISRPDLGGNSTLARLGALSLGVYAIHFLYVTVLLNVYDIIEMNPYWEILYPLCAFALSLGTAFLLSNLDFIRQFVMVHAGSDRMAAAPPSGAR